MARIDETTVVHVTFSIDDPVVADAISTDLVDRRLVACAKRRGPVRSTYSWDGVVQCAEEWHVELTTTARAQRAVVGAVAELHPYQVPEVVVVPVIGGHFPFIEWVEAQVDVPGDAVIGAK